MRGTPGKTNLFLDCEKCGRMKFTIATTEYCNGEGKYAENYDEISSSSPKCKEYKNRELQSKNWSDCLLYEEIIDYKRDFPQNK
jgi:hypothetical protein